jgi:hypothetical protein
MSAFLRIERLWVYGGALAALVLLALVPLVWDVWPTSLTAIFLGLPFYMLHQFEEHDDNRFGKFVTEHIGKGREVLGFRVIFWINIGFVWAWFVLVLYLMRYVSVGLGLLAVYPVFFNAVIHVGQAIRMRIYNPGLATSIVLLLPWSLWAGNTINATGRVQDSHYVYALAAALGIHGIIIGYVMRRLRSKGGTFP